jgi:hypothetical protein
MVMKWIWLGVLGAVASGCAYESDYYERTYYPQPAETAPPVSQYSIPPTNPKGSVTVLSLGPEQLPVAAGQPSSYLHLRIAPENRTDDVAWTVDPNEQLLAFPGGSVKASFAESSAGTPVLTLVKGAHGYLDVYYPAPAAGNRVSLSWKVHRGTEVAGGSTDFDRIAAPDSAYARYEPAGPNVYVGLGLGWWWPSYAWWGSPWWWGDAYWPYYGFHGGFYGYRGGYYGGHYPRYYGGYYGARGYTGGRVYVPSTGGWRGGTGGGYRAAPSGGGYHSAPSGGGGYHGGGGGGWRGGGGRR